MKCQPPIAAMPLAGLERTDVGAKWVQLWIRSAEPPGTVGSSSAGQCLTNWAIGHPHFRDAFIYKRTRLKA